MRFLAGGLLTIVLSASATPGAAQDKYATFVGQYAASVHISNSCKGITTYNAQGAGSIAKEQEGLRRQKVLRLIYYGKTDQLMKLGRSALKNREVNPGNQTQLCHFAQKVAGKADQIGRFLRAK